MEKNVKIDTKTHQRLSIEAAQTGIKKGTLTAALINAALDMPCDLRADFLARYLEYYVRTDENSRQPLDTTMESPTP